MSFYIGREASKVRFISLVCQYLLFKQILIGLLVAACIDFALVFVSFLKLWKRFCAEIATELNLLAENWKYILGGIVCQYIHGVAARGVHYFHRPGPTLQDVGFFLLPELGQERAYISETVFSFIFLSFVLVMDFPSFHIEDQEDIHSPDMVQGPCIFSRMSVSSDHNFLLYSTAWSKLSLSRGNSKKTLVLFSVDGSKLATLPPPNNVLEALLIVPRGVLYGCGDLIFSSHMIFSLVFVRTYHKYGTRSFVKQLAWLTVVIQSLLIVASRKHYTVDVIVAWYTVNLVVFFLDKKLPELPDRSSASAALFLPLTKDNKTKEENQKLLNGNSGDAADWRPRTQINGKIMEEGNVVHVEAVISSV
ncbi:hypothetical protein SASPL_108721 [Salvia splendens]|uniref:Sphingomyelin synthase-like domain-containing protein n=1 Tax=Salvia splendens TaxID=180675 RepID=A0A8X9A8G8_SALSN|nr:hypothetical protein SASPL_108721 [Salvia splendens]